MERSAAGQKWGTYHQHEKEDDRPDRPARQLQDNLRIRDEHEAGPSADHLLDIDPLVVGHVAEDGEGDRAGQQAGRGVHEAGDDGVPLS